MALQGLDRAEAPAAAEAKAMLEEIHGSWWNVYIGGPRVNDAAALSWTPSRVREFVDQGITRFLLTYVGRQVLPASDVDDAQLLTTAQGKLDGAEACQIAAERFGFGADTPICLDLERSTFDASPRGSLDYAGGWCQAVRARGFRPGVYANPKPLEELARRDDRPDWVFVAAFVRHTVDPDADPHRIPSLGNDLFPDPGQRAWQYAAAFGGTAATVGGLDVDISVADSGCLTGSAFSAGLVPGGLSAADADQILRELAEMRTQIDLLYRRANHGDADRSPMEAGGDFNRKAIRRVVDDIAEDVKALTDAQPHG
jgi:Rv2525c-like, glycoside hydrolase-like domain